MFESRRSIFNTANSVLMGHPHPCFPSRFFYLGQLHSFEQTKKELKNWHKPVGHAQEAEEPTKRKNPCLEALKEPSHL